MKILVDADACPVKDIIETLAREYCLELILVSNINHEISSDYGEVVMVDSMAEAADMAIVNRTRPEDIVITQDYGLASMVLAKGGRAIHPMGKEFTANNIEGLLLQRFINQKARRAGKRIGGPRKRNALDNSLFETRLKQMIQEQIKMLNSDE